MGVGTVTVIRYFPARKDGKFPICIRVGKDRKYNYEVLCYVKESHWNDSAKQVHSYERDSTSFNSLIRRRYKEVAELLEHYEQKGWPYTAKELLAIDYAKWKENEKKVRQAEKSNLPTGFLAFIKNFVIPFWTGQNNLKNAEKYMLEMDLFRLFLQSLKPKKADVSMTDFSVDLIQTYFHYLRTKKNPCRKDSTLKRKLAQIEAVLNLAHRKGVIASVPSLEVPLDVKKAKKPKLSKDQIEILGSHEWGFEGITNKQSLGAAKINRLAVQTFLTQYYLFGARVGDIMALKNSNVVAQKGKPVRIEYYQQKGRKSEGKRMMSINIAPKLLPIILEYWKPDQPDAFLFPWLVDRYEYDLRASPAENNYKLKEAIHQATSLNNTALKRVCGLLDLDLDKLTSHSARHTYAQRAKEKGKSIEFIKDSLGHSAYDTTAIYLTDLDADELNKQLEDVYD